MALNVPFVALVSSACSVLASMYASVTIKESIVAISGAIIPAPLAKPLSVTSIPEITALRVASFGKVSVVIMARAASAQFSGLACAISGASFP